MPRNGVSSAAPSRAPPRPAGRSRGSASRPPSISSHRAHGASQASPSASRSPFAKPKGGTVSEPEEAASPRATSSRNGGRDHLGTVGEIIPEWWATSSGISSHPANHKDPLTRHESAEGHATGSRRE